ncbi:SNF2 family DNA-dependent ATPase domain-containing protein [Aureobasidium sp. EXF-12298]|nr:SNF2 family DNA-dependent ATPase domain-containing protein [Aureobasidium sp. EXF-12298]KAI4761056.1 SNF2 family DNA-dependent ATPase domain-containing protein [Aureobasidium sp. EXF-12344]KAI4778349.1 SNF2 family DNA-dependent ATPase domain-containing protein [Aureobasidium sp. EXF-3400]
MPPRSIPWMAPNGAKQGQTYDSSKRKREVVDLTEDETRSTPKTSRTSSTRTPSHSQRSSGPSSAAGKERSFARTPSWTQPTQVPPWTPPQQHSQAERDAWLQEEDNEIFENVDSSQSAPVAHEQYQKYGSLDTKIVGVRFYTGFATVGERITIKREPTDPYDSNAIAINFFGPPLSSPLSEEVRERMMVDRLPTQDISRFERDQKKMEQTVERKRAANSQFTASQAPGLGGSQEQTMQDIISGSERFNPRDVSRAAEQFGTSEDDLAAMVKAKQPMRLSTTMLPYQLQALAWMLDKENPKVPAKGSKDFVQLWRRHERYPNAFTNIATNFSIKDKEPVLASGGILADDMGLGKTLEMISLLVSDLEDFTPSQQGESSATLIVAPLSVMSNWSDQIARHVRKDQPLRVYTYHGAGKKSMGPKDFSEYDVVITTYQTLASDWASGGKPPKSKGLYSVHWRRVILDEGHNVRNPTSKSASAVTAVLARSRWVLTGTPIINSLKDLYSLLRFIGITGGLEKLEVFNSVLVRPVKNNDSSAIALLQAIMSSFTLRRRKEMKFVDLKLPELSEFVHRIEFADKEKERYAALFKEAQGTLSSFHKVEGQKASETYRYLLEILLRLRQVCNHWQMCSERVTNLMEQIQKQKVVELTPENMKALQDMLSLSIQSQEECAVCLDDLHNPVITPCAHVFGRECIERVIETQQKCPMCRAELKDNSVLVQPANDFGDEARDDSIDFDASNTKLEALIEILKASKGTGNKTVVFSHWTKFLDIVQARLDRDGYKYCRLDGTMSVRLRDSALHALEEDPDCTIMLASLGVCSVGLNLVAANQVILSDSWWAPAIEDQAVDRVHRLGQTEKISVFRLVMEGSIEERTLDIQAEKRKLMMMAFQEKEEQD